MSFYVAPSPSGGPKSTSTIPPLLFYLLIWHVTQMLPRASCPPFEYGATLRFRARRPAPGIAAIVGHNNNSTSITLESAITTSAMADAEAERKAKAERAKKLVSDRPNGDMTG